ncbi:MAG: type II toxin-antitoxin system VapC family toxin [Candidatus Azobacteroides sp.]|nr:type II toxin-antitoxin system VapC family toxin [Candidatus Azobacteroides sp.]
MVKETILIDTSLFIDYYRKQKKESTVLVKLSEKYNFAISVITKFELLVGVLTKEQYTFWNNIFNDLTVFPIVDKEVERSAEIVKYLRKNNKMIGLQDILIAATAIENNLGMATLNHKDFVRIPDLKLLSVIN